MSEGNWIIAIIIIASIVWAYFDAKAIGVKKGMVKGLADMNIGGWIGGMILLWIVVFPLYLIKRGGFKKRNNSQGLGVKKTLTGAALLVVIFIGINFLAGGRASAPSCNDDGTKNLVLSVANDTLKKQEKTIRELRSYENIGDARWDKEWKKLTERVKMSVENIRTKSFNKNTGSYECAADFIIENNGQRKAHPIFYTSELVEDKKGQFVVNVMGL
jgi:hypothetical protein